MWWRRTQFRWLPKRSKVRELSRWPCCYLKRLPQMENWERHCDPQIYRKDFIRRCSQTFTTLFRPINRFTCNCNTDPFSIFKTSSTLGQKIRLPIDFKTEIEYLRYILNYCLTRLDTLDEITSENPVPWMKHPLRHKLLHKKWNHNPEYWVRSTICSFKWWWKWNRNAYNEQQKTYPWG